VKFFELHGEGKSFLLFKLRFHRKQTLSKTTIMARRQT